MISITCLIYRSTQYADMIWDSLHEFTPHLHDRRAKFFFVANDATPELKNHLKQRGYTFVSQENVHRPMEELWPMGYDLPEYMHRVYRGWNRAVRESEEQMVLISSDMAFSPGWLEGMERVWNPMLAVGSKLVERLHPLTGIPKYVPGSKGVYVGDFGDHPKRFNKAGFLEFRNQMWKQDQEPGTAYGPLMMSRSKVIEAGLFPEGNLPGPRPGDQILFGRLKALGVEHVDAMDSITYHFREGEMNE